MAVSQPIIAVPKKGDLTKAVKSRDISLRSVATNFYYRILLLRLQPLYKQLLAVESGFRQRRSTAELILAL